MKLEGIQDMALLRQLNMGDEQAFGYVFHKYYAVLCFFANKFLQDEEAARDVVQEVFIRFYGKNYDFPNWIALKSFLYSCVQNRALNDLEKRNHRTAICQKMDITDYQENEYFLRQVEAEMFQEIFAAVEQLPTECRRIFKMSYIENKSIQEIVKILGVSEATVKTQRQRAKKYLRKRLKNLFSLAAFLFFS